MERNRNMKTYYTLVVLEDGTWAIAFGDYSRAVVAQEREDSYPDDKCKIIKTDHAQSAIETGVARLNK